MVDIISTRFQGVYDSWNVIKNVPPPTTIRPDDRTSFISARQQREQRKEQDEADHLAELKVLFVCLNAISSPTNF